jgi:hypothetical protein
LDRNGLNDLYCRLYINEYQTIKTKVIYKSLNPVWNEEYVLDVVDLSDKQLTVKIWDEDTALDDKLGYVVIDLDATLGDGKLVDEWYKIYKKKQPPSSREGDVDSSTSKKHGLKKRKSSKIRGQLHLQLQYVKYSSLLNLLLEPENTILSALLSQENVIKDDLAAAVVAVLKENEKSLRNLIEKVLCKEIENTSTAETLFRTNTTATKLLGELGRLEGIDWLHSVLGPLVNAVCHKPEAVEIDPAKLGPKEQREVNLNRLRNSTTQFFDAICSSLTEAPPLLLEVCSIIKELVRARFPGYEIKAVGGFIFLRFFCPGIISPEKYGLIEHPPSDAARRQLVLVAKVIQNIANATQFSQKEPYMHEMNEYVNFHVPKAQSFLTKLASGNVAHAPSRQPLPASVVIHHLDLLVDSLHARLTKLDAVLQEKNRPQSEIMKTEVQKIRPLLEIQKRQTQKEQRKLESRRSGFLLIPQNSAKPHSEN